MNQVALSDFGTKVKTIRTNLGLSQVALAKALGVSFPTVNRWENGRTKPSHLAWNKLLQLKTELKPDEESEFEQPGGENKSLNIQSNFETLEIQEGGNVMTELMAMKARTNAPLTFTLQISLGDEKEKPSDEVIHGFNRIFEWLKKGPLVS